MEEKLETMEDDRNWLKRQLKSCKKQNKLLRAELQIRLNVQAHGNGGPYTSSSSVLAQSPIGGQLAAAGAAGACQERQSLVWARKCRGRGRGYAAFSCRCDPVPCSSPLSLCLCAEWGRKDLAFDQTIRTHAVAHTHIQTLMVHPPPPLPVVYCLVVLLSCLLSCCRLSCCLVVCCLVVCCVVVLLSVVLMSVVLLSVVLLSVVGVVL